MLGIIDILILGVILISVFFALYRGLVRELLGISSWLLAGFAALYGYNPLLKACEGTFENAKLAAIISSVFLALVILIIMTIINAAVARRLRKSSLSGLDRIFGFVFGVARALLIVALVYIFAATMVLSPKLVQKMSENNRSIAYVQWMAEKLQSVFPDNIKADLNAYQTTKVAKIKQAKEDFEQKAKEKAEETVAEYTEQQRDSLDDMIENIPDIIGVDE